MSTNQLFELASLDALGLLDDVEREEFEAAFRSAPPHVQAQVRRQQLRLTDLEDVLPEVQPPPGLKSRVMAAVRQAIAAVAADHQPITASAAEGPVARIMNFAPLWRAACIGFATASLVLGWFLIDFAKTAQRIKGINESITLDEQVQQIGPFVAILYDPAHRKQALAPIGEDVGGCQATLFYLPDSPNALLFCSNLPHGSGSYSLVVEREDGGIIDRVTRAEFVANGGPRQHVAVEGLQMSDVARLAIYFEDGDKILESADL